MNNLEYIIQILSAVANPKEFIIKELRTIAPNNSIANTAIDILSNPSKQGELELLVRNLYKERGLDINKDLNTFYKR